MKVLKVSNVKNTLKYIQHQIKISLRFSKLVDLNQASSMELCKEL